MPTASGAVDYNLKHIHRALAIPFEGYSEENIVLDEDGGRNVAGEVVFLPKKMVLVKVLYDWLLRERTGVVGTCFISV